MLDIKGENYMMFEQVIYFLLYYSIKDDIIKIFYF